MSSLWTGQKSPWRSSELPRETNPRTSSALNHLVANSQAVKPTGFETLIAFVQRFQA